MESKRAFRNILFVCMVSGYLTVSVDFCTSISLSTYVGSSKKESSLILNGSNSAVRIPSHSPSQTACTCTISPVSANADKLQVDLKYSPGSKDTRSCDKSVSVQRRDGTAIHTFGCASENIGIEADDLSTDIRFTLNVFDQSGRATDDVYHLYIVPEPVSALTVRCYLPIATEPTSSTTASLNSSSTSTYSPLTTRAFVSLKSSGLDTMVVIGVVIGLGLFFLIVIICVLFYRARHRCEHEDLGMTKLPAPLTPQRRNMISRTMTILYVKMKVNRPLPRIPTSIRNIAIWKTRQNHESGIYDSIKLNNSNTTYVGTKQQSMQSDYSYLEASAVSSISGSVIRNDSNYLHPISKNNLKIKVSKQLSVESNDSYVSPEALSVGVDKRDSNYLKASDNTYIHPLANNVSDSSLRNAHTLVSHKHDPIKDIYMNVRKEPLVMDDTNEHDVSTGPKTVVDDIEEENVAIARVPVMQDIKRLCVDTVSGDSHYTQMGSNADVNAVKDNAIAKGADTNPNTVKHYLEGVDSTGYVSMNFVDKCNSKPILQPQDSTFPELVQCTSPLKSVNEMNGKNCKDVRQNTNTETNTGNIQKNKRYVKDKNQNKY